MFIIQKYACNRRAIDPKISLFWGFSDKHANNSNNKGNDNKKNDEEKNLLLHGMSILTQLGKTINPLTNKTSKLSFFAIKSMKRSRYNSARVIC